MTAIAPLSVVVPTIDGVKATGEWDDANSYYFDAVDTARPGWPNPDTAVSPASDWSCTFYVKHDAGYVYVLCQVTDDVISNDTGANLWEDDTMEMYFDSNNGNANPKEGDQTGFQISYCSDNVTQGGQGYNNYWEAHAVIGPPGYVMEFRVSKSITGMVTGGKYGFDLSPDDDDDGTGRDLQVWWNAKDANAWNDETPWGDIILSPDPKVPPIPDAPANLQATARDGGARLQWDEPAGLPSEYRIKQSATAGGPYNQVTTTSLLVKDITGLTNGTPYYFVVTAANAAGEGPDSTEVSVTPQAGVSLGIRRWELYR